mmetsp:Transcript_176604/g.566265  ORF Transcript_176604/g.566265 Transcript_176604/m.566265 type:complete len:468 (-) Transcript_176604:103-1506(-)
MRPSGLVRDVAGVSAWQQQRLFKHRDGSDHMQAGLLGAAAICDLRRLRPPITQRHEARRGFPPSDGGARHDLLRRWPRVGHVVRGRPIAARWRRPPIAPRLEPGAGGRRRCFCCGGLGGDGEHGAWPQLPDALTSCSLAAASHAPGPCDATGSLLHRRPFRLSDALRAGVCLSVAAAAKLRGSTAGQQHGGAYLRRPVLAILPRQHVLGLLLRGGGSAAAAAAVRGRPLGGCGDSGAGARAGRTGTADANAALHVREAGALHSAVAHQQPGPLCPQCRARRGYGGPRRPPDVGRHRRHSNGGRWPDRRCVRGHGRGRLAAATAAAEQLERRHIPGHSHLQQHLGQWWRGECGGGDGCCLGGLAVFSPQGRRPRAVPQRRRGRRRRLSVLLGRRWGRFGSGHRGGSRTGAAGAGEEPDEAALAPGRRQERRRHRATLAPGGVQRPEGRRRIIDAEVRQNAEQVGEAGQ